MFVRSIQLRAFGDYVNENEFKYFTRDMNQIDSIYVSKCSGIFPTDCKLTNWEKWGDCIDNQKTRHRKILKEGSNGGKTWDEYDCRQTKRCIMGT